MTQLVAPGDLEVVRAFVNTINLESGVDRMEKPAALRAWLSEQGLLEGVARVTAKDVELAKAVREAIRALLRANAGDDLDPDAIRVLDRAAETTGVRLRFSATGARLESGAGGARGAIGSLLAIVAAAMGEGTFDRMKACREGSCLWAFYDHSKNRSRTWCSMKVCGNRTKVRSYRRRQGDD
ncbi:MAG: CGNR zinc finger domain-containing protein [Planctomycetota bacterium]